MITVITLDFNLILCSRSGICWVKNKKIPFTSPLLWFDMVAFSRRVRATPIESNSSSHTIVHDQIGEDEIQTQDIGDFMIINWI